MQRGFEVAKTGGNKGGDRKHQWGAETSTQPLAIMHDKPSPTRVVLGYVAIACTVISWLVYMITMILSLFVNNPSLTLRFVVEGVLYMTIVTTLIFSALVYLTTRQGRYTASSGMSVCLERCSMTISHTTTAKASPY